MRTEMSGSSRTIPTNQPNFFANNTPPDYNTYHLSTTSAAHFVYDNNNTRSNKRKTFAQPPGGACGCSRYRGHELH